MLHAHPRISFLPETHFFRRYVGPTLRRLRTRTEGAESLHRSLAEDREFGRSEIAPDELLAPFLDGTASFRPPEVYRRLLRIHARRVDGAIVGDKDPRLIDFFPEIDRFVPKARVIHVVRDPRDVLLSRREAAWSRGRSDWSHILAYHAQMKRAIRTGPGLLGRRYMEVHYEELLQQPETVLSRLCEFVGISFDPAMLSFGEGANDLVGEDEWQWKKETTGPLMQDNMRKWKGELSERTRRLVEETCIVPFPELGYTPSDRQETEGRRRPFIGHRVLAELFSRLYPLRTLVS